MKTKAILDCNTALDLQIEWMSTLTPEELGRVIETINAEQSNLQGKMLELQAKLSRLEILEDYATDELLRQEDYALDVGRRQSKVLESVHESICRFSRLVNNKGQL